MGSAGDECRILQVRHQLGQYSRQAALARGPYRSELLFYKEGLSSVIAVGRDHLSGTLWLSNNGKVDASTGGDMQTQVLMAHLPFIYRPDSANVLVIGLGSGVTAGSLTLHKAARRIDIVELELAVVTASHWFDALNHRPLIDPRVRLHVNDARNHLLLTRDGTYDLISSEPSNPWISGVSNLFTREFFTLGKHKLRPGGVWAQWLHIYGMAPDDLRSLLATFAAVYNDVRLYHVNVSDLILVGSDEPLNLRAAAIERMMQANPAMAEDLRRIDIERSEDLVAQYLSGRVNLMHIAGPVEHNTDDNMRIEYAAPLHMHIATGKQNLRLLYSRVELPLSALSSPGSRHRLIEAYAARNDIRAQALQSYQVAEANR